MTQQTLCELNTTLIHIPSASDAPLQELYAAEGTIYPALTIPALPLTPSPFSVPTLNLPPPPPSLASTLLASLRSSSSPLATPLVALVDTLASLATTLRLLPPSSSRSSLPPHLGGDGHPAQDAAARSLAFHPYLHRLALGLRDGSVHIYDLADSVWLPISLRHEFQQDVFALAWRPNAGHTLAVGTGSGIALWSLPMQRPRSIRRSQAGDSQAMGRGGGGGGGGTGNMAGKGNGLGASRGVGGNGGGGTSAVGGSAAVMRAAAFVGGRSDAGMMGADPGSDIQSPWMRFLSSGDGPITNLAWNPDGTLLAAASPSSPDLVVWSMDIGLPTRLSRAGGGVSLVSWSPSGNYLLAASTGNTFRIWETSSWTAEKWTLDAPVTSIVWSHDSRFVLVAIQGRSDIFAYRLDRHPPIIDAELSQVHRIPRTVNGAPLYRTTPAPSSQFSPTSPAVARNLDSELAQDDPKGKGEVDDNTNDDDQDQQSGGVHLGGSISEMAWDGTSERLVVSFEDSPYMLVFHTAVTPDLRLNIRGVIKPALDEGVEGTPHGLSFRPNFSRGALLTCFSSISSTIHFLPFYFISELSLKDQVSRSKW